jgi:phage tail sheath protein FI
MPITPTYPGVYVEELPSSVHTISGASTSNTAFIDFFERGPVDQATRITSYSDFERLFGGLDKRSDASYQIYQYYLNGGSIGYVVRVVPKSSATAVAELNKADLVVPQNVKLKAKEQAAFSATVPDNVTYSLRVVEGTERDWKASDQNKFGSVSSSTGMYTAPDAVTGGADLTVKVKATCVGNCGKPVQNATITLVAPKITVSSAAGDNPELGPGQTLQLTAATAGLNGSKVTWTVDQAGAVSVDSNGLLTVKGDTSQDASFKINAKTASPALSSADFPVKVVAAGKVVPSNNAVDQDQSVWFQAFVKDADTETFDWYIGNDAATGKKQGETGPKFCFYASADNLAGLQPTNGVYTVTVVSKPASGAETTGTVKVRAKGTPVISAQSPINIELLEKRQFSASLVADPDGDVVWSIAGDGGDPSAWGSIDSASGLYSAPGSLAQPTTGIKVTVTATNKADASQKSTVDVNIVPPTTRFRVEASSAGDWGNALRVVALAPSKGTTKPVFGLQVVELDSDGKRVNSESYSGLSRDSDDPNYCVSRLEESSTLVRIVDFGSAYPDPFYAPAPSDAAFIAFSGGSDGVWDGTEFADALKTAVTDDDSPLSYLAPEEFNILCIPAAANMDNSPAGAVYALAAKYCEDKRAFLIVDCPSSEKVRNAQQMAAWLQSNLGSYNKDCSAIYYPRVIVPDPLNAYRDKEVGACGTLAGIYAATDSGRGIWKAPAGTDAALTGAVPVYVMKDSDSGLLNPLGINAIRSFPVYGILSWGARTLRGADDLADQWKYIPVRRVAQYIENSLFKGLTWAVFEPNDTPLWAAITANVTAFMNGLFRQGAFQGSSPAQAYFVRCDKSTTTQTDVDNGRVNVVVGFAPLKPAEFVVIQIQQIAGQTSA